MALPLAANTSLAYFAEGAANIVYRIESLSDPRDKDLAPSEIDRRGPESPPPTELEPWEAETDLPEESKLGGWLLRLRKDLSTATGVEEAQQDFEEHIAPLFSEHEVVTQRLIEVPSEITDRLNSALVTMDRDGSRPQKRRGVHLVRSGFGQLVRDMSSHSAADVVTIDIKPKWLVQSPNAPEGAKRCRTCALHASRNAEVAKSGGRDSSPGFCPLDLISGNEAKVSGAVQAVLESSPSLARADRTLNRRLVTYLTSFPLLKKLRRLQQELDPSGPLRAVADDKHFLTAMTLRDCTLYLKVRNVH